MRSSFCLVLAVVLAAVIIPDQAMAQAAAAPTQDIPNARDNPLLRRYDGSFIVDYAQRAFEEFELPTAELKQVPGKKDARNNDVFAPTAAEALEGRLTRIVYVAPAQRSPLEVISNYQEEITGKGGAVLFSCRDEACGGETRESSSGGGGRQGMPVKIYPYADVKAPTRAPATAPSPIGSPACATRRCGCPRPAETPMPPLSPIPCGVARAARR